MVHVKGQRFVNRSAGSQSDSASISLRSPATSLRLLSGGMTLFMVKAILVVLLGSFSAHASAANRNVLVDATSPQGHSDAYDESVPAERAAALPLIIRVTGYGAYDAKAKQSANKRLMAIRTSRLDAYRNLAERVYGFSVAGASTVKDFMLESDHFATSVDSVVRGARVVSISDNPATGIETVVELELPGDFERCLNKVNNFKYRDDCLRPMSSMGSPSNSALRRSSEEPRMQALYHLN